VYIGNSNSGSVHIYLQNDETLHKLDTDQLLSAAHQALMTRQYDSVLKLCNHILAKDPHRHEANLLASVALFRGRPPGQLPENDLTQILPRLRQCTECRTAHSTAATAWAILGILQIDYYMYNSLASPLDNLPHIKEQLNNCQAYGPVNRELL